MWEQFTDKIGFWLFATAGILWAFVKVLNPLISGLSFISKELKKIKIKRERAKKQKQKDEEDKKKKELEQWRDNYYNTLNGKEFLTWQNKALEWIYGEDYTTKDFVGTDFPRIYN